MKRIYLEVPFSEKENAKEYGAKWDKSNGLWYIDSEVSSTQITKYIPNSIIIAPLFYYTVSCNCWKCKNENQLAIFTTKNIFEPKEYIENEIMDELDSTIKLDELNELILGLLNSEYIESKFENYSDCDISISDLNFTKDKLLKQEIIEKLPNYKQSYSKTLGKKVYANHCTKCGALQGNFFLAELDLNEYNGGSTKRNIELFKLNSNNVIVTDFDYGRTITYDIAESVENFNIK